MLLMLAWACRLHMSQHDCLSLSGKEFICWIKTALRDMLDQNCSRQCCSPHFLSAAMRGHYNSLSVMAAAARSKLKLGICQCRCLRLANLTATEIPFCVSLCELRVASPAHARAFVPARGCQVWQQSTTPCGEVEKGDAHRGPPPAASGRQEPGVPADWLQPLHPHLHTVLMHLLMQVVVHGQANRAPVALDLQLRKYGHLDQSLYARFVRLKTPTVDLNLQGRARQRTSSVIGFQRWGEA